MPSQGKARVFPPVSFPHSSSDVSKAPPLCSAIHETSVLIQAVVLFAGAELSPLFWWQLAAKCPDARGQMAVRRPNKKGQTRWWNCLLPCCPRWGWEEGGDSSSSDKDSSSLFVKVGALPPEDCMHVQEVGPPLLWCNQGSGVVAEQ